MKNFRAADKSHAHGDEKHGINFHWPKLALLAVETDVTSLKTKAFFEKQGL